MKILVAPLDWGLGHATRCIPIIRAPASKQGIQWNWRRAAPSRLCTRANSRNSLARIPVLRDTLSKVGLAMPFWLLKTYRASRAVMAAEHERAEELVEMRLRCYHFRITVSAAIP